MTARALVTLLILASVVSAADQVDRRDRAEPEVVVQAGGRAGTCDVLKFSPDGKFLFAAGDDKVVTVWPHTDVGLVTAPDKMSVLRWPAWRERRGGIKAVGVSQDGTRVAVGGLGFQTSSVAVIDRTQSSRELTVIAAYTWPKVREGIDFGAVTAVALSVDGVRVAFGTADGSLWVWEPKDKLPKPDENGREWPAPVRAGQHRTKGPQPPDGNNSSQLIAFRDGNKLLSVSTGGQVLECPITASLTDDPTVPPPAGVELLNLFDGQPANGRVYRAELTADGKGVVAGVNAVPANFVLIRSLDKAGAVRLPLPADHFPRGLAVDPNSERIAIGVGRMKPAAPGAPRFPLEADEQVWVYDAPKEGAAPDHKLSRSGKVEALAFHPTAKDRLAVAGGDADEVTLLDLKKPNELLTVARGLGRKVFAVSLEGSGNLLRVRAARDPQATHPNALGTGGWSGLDLKRLVATTDTGEQGHTWVGAVGEADGWTVGPDAASRAVWYAVGTVGGKPVRIPLKIDRRLFNFPTCYTFIPKTATAPTRLLVGHYLGCSLYHLPAGGTPPAELLPARNYLGHTSEVLSVAAAKDGKWFVSGGADQTVAAFTLDDTSSAALGAAFAAAPGGQRLAVTAVTGGSPAWEAGLQVGDQIDLLAVGGDLVFDRRPGQKAGNPAQALAALKNPVLGVELYFGVLPKNQGKRRETLTSLKHRPLWKWFPAFDDGGRMTDWVIWMWKGWYYHTTTHGDRLVGWHVNAPSAGGDVRYHTLNSLRRQFQKPNAILKLIGSRDVADTLQSVRGDSPASFARYQPAEVAVNVSASRVTDRAVTANISVKPTGSDVDLLPDKVELWVNDYRVKTWPGDPARAFEQSVDLDPDLFREGENQISVLTFTPQGGRAEASRTVVNTTPAVPPSLHGLMVGVNDYGKHREVSGGDRATLVNLKYANADAISLTTVLEGYTGRDRFFRDGRLRRVTDEQAELDRLTQDLAALKGRAKPNDVLVLFLAGHGVLLGDKDGTTQVLGPGADAEEYRNVRFVFCFHNFDVRNPVATSLPAAALFDRLADVNCRKMVLFDVCHSGAAAEADLIRRFVPDGQGPVVIASCNNNQLSYESEELKHGLFTAALLDAIGDRYQADRNRNGDVTYAELTSYVADRVSQLRRQTTKRAVSDQNPISFPLRPSDDVLLRRVVSR